MGRLLWTASLELGRLLSLGELFMEYILESRRILFVDVKFFAWHSRNHHQVG